MNINESLIQKIKDLRSISEAAEPQSKFYDDIDNDNHPFDYQDFGDNQVISGEKFNDGSESYIWDKPYSSIESIGENQYQLWSATNVYTDETVYFVVDIDTGYIYKGPFETLDKVDDRFTAADKEETTKLDKPTQNNIVVEESCQSEDFQSDLDSIKAEFGQVTYDALKDYIDNGHDLEKVLYDEAEWDQFEKWLKTNKGIVLNSLNKSNLNSDKVEMISEADLQDSDDNNYIWPTSNDICEINDKVLSDISYEIKGVGDNVEAPDYDNYINRFDAEYIKLFTDLNRLDYSEFNDEDLTWLAEQADEARAQSNCCLNNQLAYSNYIQDEAESQEAAYKDWQKELDNAANAFKLVNENVMDDIKSNNIADFIEKSNLHGAITDQFLRSDVDENTGERYQTAIIGFETMDPKFVSELRPICKAKGFDVYSNENTVFIYKYSDNVNESLEDIETEPEAQIEVVSEEIPEIVSDNQLPEDIVETATKVMEAYQNANKWMDIIKEFLFTDMGCPFFSSYIHNLAHTFPQRFDKFGEILHTVDMRIPYPATQYIPNEPQGIDDVFNLTFMILDAIKTALNDFIKCTDENYHGMSCAAETLLNDIEAEYVPLYKMRKAWTEYQEPMRFDRWIGTYAEKRSDLNESLNESTFLHSNEEIEKCAKSIANSKNMKLCPYDDIDEVVEFVNGEVGVCLCDDTTEYTEVMFTEDEFWSHLNESTSESMLIMGRPYKTCRGCGKHYSFDEKSYPATPYKGEICQDCWDSSSEEHKRLTKQLYPEWDYLNNELID